MPNDRTAIATAAIGSVLACMVAVAHPAVIPAMTVGLTVFGALYLFLKL